MAAQFAQSDIAEMDFTPDSSQLYLLIGEPTNNGQPVGGGLWCLDLASNTLEPLYRPRTLTAAGIVSSSFLTPGGFITVYGTNLIPDDSLLTPSSYPAPLMLGGVSLSIDGSPAPLLAATPWQINAQISMDTAPGSGSVALQFADGTSTPP